MNQVRVLKPVGVLMVGVACAATCKVGVTQPIQLMHWWFQNVGW